MSYHVRFENVGRDNKTWECEVPALTERDLNRETRKVLMSRYIGYDLDDADYAAGDIYAGDRHAGTFTFWKRTNESVAAVQGKEQGRASAWSARSAGGAWGLLRHRKNWQAALGSISPTGRLIRLTHRARPRDELINKGERQSK